jgi:phage shock protein PspC (stress-responsive transcriptional regulator)
MAKLVRSTDKVFAGVCAGLAEFFGLNVRSVRLVWVILSVVGVGSPVLFYLILMLLMPDSGVKASYEERMNRRLGKNR